MIERSPQDDIIDEIPASRWRGRIKLCGVKNETWRFRLALANPQLPSYHFHFLFAKSALDGRLALSRTVLVFHEAPG